MLFGVSAVGYLPRREAPAICFSLACGGPWLCVGGKPLFGNSQPLDPGRVDVAKRAVKHPPVVSVQEAVSASVATPPSPEPELQLLRQARADLQRGQPESAFRRLCDYDREHGPGVLTQERQALKAWSKARS